MTSPRRTVGPSIYTGTTQGERPYYFVGYGAFGTVAADVPILNDLGCSFMQNEIGPDSVIVPRGQGSHDGLTEEDQFDVSTAAITGRVVPLLQNAERHNVAVSLLLSMHYFPAFLYDLYPDLKFKESDAFIRFHIEHPVAKRVIEVYLRTIIPLVSQYDSLFELCMTNEPTYASCKGDYDLPRWHAWLENKYASVAVLNEALGTSFTSFGEIHMPAFESRTPFGLEWVLFNNDLFAGWHRWMASIIKEYTDVPVDAKVMNYTVYDCLTSWRGTDYKQYASFMDYNSCDAGDSITLDAPRHFCKMLWYDYLGDIKNAPIVNSEDHVISDRAALYSDDENKRLASFVGADMWQGAVYGRDASAIWVWERSYDDENDLNGSILTRPECIASVGETALDINRLAYEIQAFDNTKEEVAILFSQASRVFDEKAMDFLILANQGAQSAGKTVRLVTEDAVGSLPDGLMLIVPNCVAVKASTLSAVNEYAKAGNKVLLMSRCMDNDEQGNPQNPGLLAEVYENCEVYGFNPLWSLIKTAVRILETVKTLFRFLSFNTEFIDNAVDSLKYYRNFATVLFTSPVMIMTAWHIRNKILANCPNDVQFVSGLFNTKLMDAPWRVTEYNGKLLVDICNYTDNPIKNVSLVYKGKTLGTLDELISQKTVEDGFTLEPYEPMLFSINVG